VGSALWLAIIALAINSVIGLFYYLRIVVALFTPAGDVPHPAEELSRSGGVVLALLTLLLVWLGVYPGPMIELIRTTVQSLIY
jgi:NADH-quinone oxidoreductase subunit N